MANRTHNQRNSLLIIPLIFILSCNGITEESQLSDGRNKKHWVDQEYQALDTISLETPEVKISQIDFQFTNTEKEILLFDKLLSRYLIFSEENKEYEVITDSTYEKYASRPTSVYLKDSIQHILYIYNQIVLKRNLKNDSIEVIYLDELPRQPFHSSRERMEVLANGNYLIPTGLNFYFQQDGKLIDQYDESAEDLTEMESIFMLYDREGRFLREFGKFPESNRVENASLIFQRDFLYVVRDSSIFLSFPLGNELFEYDLQGDLKNEYVIDLPGYDYNSTKDDEVSVTKIAVGIEKKSEKTILYFHTVNFRSMAKISHHLYRMDLSDSIYEHSKIMNGNNFMLPHVYNDTVRLLKTYFDEENKDLLKLKLLNK